MLGCLIVVLESSGIFTRCSSLAFTSIATFVHGMAYFGRLSLALLGQSLSAARESLRDEGFTIFYAVTTGGVATDPNTQIA